MSGQFFEPLESRQMFSVGLVNGQLLVTGTSFNDLISVSESNGTITVNDNGIVSEFDSESVTKIILNGSGGADRLAANDSVTKPTTLRGGNGFDTLIGGSQSDVFEGGGGLDTVDYSARTTNLNVTLDGIANDGKAAQSVVVGRLKQLIGYGERDNVGGDVEVVIGGSGNDRMTANNGNNALHGMAGNDTLDGAGGDDVLFGGAGADQMAGGTGRDDVFYIEPGNTRSVGVNVTLDGFANDGYAPRVVDILGVPMLISEGERDNILDDVEAVSGTNNNDTLNGSDRGETLRGNGGVDIFLGKGGPDQLFGGAGNDLMFGEAGNDSLFGEGGADVLGGGEGQDEARYDEAARGSGVNVTIDGLNNDGSPARFINLMGNMVLIAEAESDNVLLDIEGVRGTEFTDSLVGDSRNNMLDGMGGPDMIYGRDGADSIFGSAGNDTLYGEGGTDQMWGNAGDDMFFGGEDWDAVHYDDDGVSRPNGVYVKFDWLPNDGTAGTDRDNVTEDVEQVFGTSGNDTLIGDERDNALNGGGGHDLLYGCGGDDALYGDQGNDRLYAGMGSNFLHGGAGDDLLISVGGGIDTTFGGEGYDSFWADFTLGHDEVGDAEDFEINAGTVHRIIEFSNPQSTGWEFVNGQFQFTSTPVSKHPMGQDLPDPYLTGPDFSPMVPLPPVANMYTNVSNLPLFGANGPQRDDVQQNQLGDCYFLAPLSGMAAANPDRIRQAVTDLGDGTYACRFMHMGSEVYVRVDGQIGTMNGTPAYAGFDANIGTWVAILEKAYTFVRSGFTDVNPPYYVNSGGSAGMAMYNMGQVGIESGFFLPGIHSSNDMMDWIDQRLSQGGVVTFSTHENPDGILVGSHVYTVVGTELGSDGVRYLRLRNPWAVDGGYNTDGNPFDGHLVMSAEQALWSLSSLAACWA